MVRIIVVRHGETVENREGIIQGQAEGTLSSNGIEQAWRLAKRLSEEKFDVILSSDLARAVDTTRQIAAFHPLTPLRICKELRERALGKFEGRMKQEISDWRRHEQELGDSIVKKYGGESVQELQARVNTFMNSLPLETYDSVLIVGHGGTNRCITNYLLNKPLQKELSPKEKQKNSAVNIFNIKQHVSMETYNCISHLN